MLQRSRSAARRSLSLLLIASAVALPVRAQSAARADQDPSDAEALALRVGTLADQLIEEGDCRGLVVLAAVAGQPVLEGGWGTAAEEGIAGTFRVGALLEPMIAVHTLQLVGAGRIALDDPVSKHLPEPQLGAEGEVVTVRDLLAHTSGLPDFVDLEFAYEPGEEAALLARVAALPLWTTPGDCCSYSHSDSLALGLMLERMYAQPLAAVLSTAVLEPLGLSSTGSQGLEVSSGDRAQREIGLRVVSGDPGPQPFGAELLVSDAGDLLRWQRALVQERLLPGTALEDLAAMPTGGTEELCAPTFRSVSLAGYAGVAHGGGMEGDRVHLARYPALDLDVVVLAHGARLDAEEVARAVARAVFDLPSPDVVDLPLSAAEIERYVGAYQVGCTTLRIVFGDGHLELVSEPHGIVPLLHQGGHVFLSADDPSLRLTFDVPPEGVATGFQLEQYGSVAAATRFD